jgi:O-antigen/teichoic acid export membrane protein
LKRDVLWSAIEAGGSAVFSVGAAFAIARLIGPEELGIGAAAVAVHILLWVAVNSLFADAIVQRANLGETMLSSAMWASIITGCAAALLQAGSGWLLAWLLDDRRLVPMGLLLALPFPLIGAGGALQGVLTRGRRYGALAARTLIGQSAGMAVGIALATQHGGAQHGGAQHGGAWAPVVQQATVSLVSALVLIRAAGWWPAAICRWREVRMLLRTGLPLTASTLVQIGRYRVFAILIGAIAGPTALGQIHVAFRLADTVREITFTALWRLLLPILSEHQHDRAALPGQVDRLLRLSSLVTMPLCGGLAVTLVPLTTLVLGPAWHDAGVAAEPLVGLMALLSLMFPSGVALVASGHARLTLFANLVGLTATVVFVLALRPATPWDAVLVWCGAQAFVSPYSLWVNGRALRTGPFRPLRAGVPMLVASGVGVAAAMATSADGAAGTLIWRMAVFGAVTLVAASPLLWRLRREWLGGPVREVAASGGPVELPRTL